ncbi:MAG TPA: Rieske 2Fe-2S domain-containing protein [Acidimicrobiales bacterium]|nr:Rieske 2Fe-2S domain-containing protein [Acidimicrobiales bacterium]
MGYIVLAIVVLVVLAGIVLLAAMRRNDANRAIGELSRETKKRDRDLATVGAVSGRDVERAAVLERRGVSTDLVAVTAAAPPVAFVPPDDDALGSTRRQFFNRSIVLMMLASLGAFGASCLAFLWPPSTAAGFGGRITVGRISDVLADIKAAGGFLYKPEGRMWITEYPIGSIEKARNVYSSSELAGMEQGVIALYQKCPHLGCRVPSCNTSQWFECPCHGSQYNRVGEKRGGPAPRGMDRFVMSVQDGVLTVDTGTVIQGPAIGVNTTGQEAEGPHCIGLAGAH